MDKIVKSIHPVIEKRTNLHNNTFNMKYHFYLSLLLLAFACAKIEPTPTPFPVDPLPIDTAYGYPPRVLYNCLDFDTIGFNYPDIPGWEKTRIASNLPTAAYGIPYFVDEMNGYLFPFGGVIYKTTDGGQTWVEVYKRPITNFLKISFSSVEHGVIACAGANNQVYFLTTYDGGNTWIQTQTIGINFNYPIQIQFVAPDLGFISGGLQNDFSINLFKTIDSAKTWTPVLQDFSSNFNGVFRFQSRDTGYYATWSNQLLRSTDGGQQWASTETLVNGASDIRSFDDSFAVVYGLDGVAITRSGGNRWDKISLRPTSAGRFFADGSAVLYQQIKACNTVTDGNTYAFVTTNDFGATWNVGPVSRTFGFVDTYCFVNERCIIYTGQDGALYKWTRL
jgi:photosystem II stability/assembly factor-like uncharacterized protein